MGSLLIVRVYVSCVFDFHTENKERGLLNELYTQIKVGKGMKKEELGGNHILSPCSYELKRWKWGEIGGGAIL